MADVRIWLPSVSSMKERGPVKVVTWVVGIVLPGFRSAVGQACLRRRGQGWPEATPEGRGLDAGAGHARVCRCGKGLSVLSVLSKGLGRVRQVPRRCGRGRPGSAAGHPFAPAGGGHGAM